MKARHIFIIAGRNFYRNLPRFRVLLVALVFVIAVFTLIVGTFSGMIHAVQSKASRYFSGHLTVQQMFVDTYPRLQQADVVIRVLDQFKDAASLITKRSVYYNAGKAELFFGGQYHKQRRLIGVDWYDELPIMTSLDYTAGYAPGKNDGDAILVSTITADALGLLLGDEVLIRLTTQSGSINTASFVVRGIFYESSLFGFSSYVQRQALNTLMDEDRESVNEIGIFLRRPQDMATVGAAVSSALTQVGPTFPILKNRQQRDAVLNLTEWSDGQFLVMTLDAQLAEIDYLIRALWAICVVLLILFAFLVVIGISNTYSFIVLERTAEIGMMRAIGMSQSKVLSLFLSESVFLGVVGISLGMLSGCAFLELLKGVFYFPGSEIASLFLVSGRLHWVLKAIHIGFISLLAMVSVLTGSYRAAWKASRLLPIDALRQE